MTVTYQIYERGTAVYDQSYIAGTNEYLSYATATHAVFYTLNLALK